MAQNDPQVNFRCPPSLKSMLEDSAKENNRTLNAEIVYRIGLSYKPDDIEKYGDPSKIKGYLKDALTEMIRNGHLKGSIPND